MPQPVRRHFMMHIARFAALAAFLGSFGCATAVSTADGERLRLSSADFREYVERVFREQNRVADELAFALETPAAERAELIGAEQQLLDACAGVNELATARRDERRLGVRRSASSARTVPACERAAREAARLLTRNLGR
jgi:hypothetical protein